MSRASLLRLARKELLCALAPLCLVPDPDLVLVLPRTLCYAMRLQSLLSSAAHCSTAVLPCAVCM